METNEYCGFDMYTRIGNKLIGSVCVFIHLEGSKQQCNNYHDDNIITMAHEFNGDVLLLVHAVCICVT